MRVLFVASGNSQFGISPFIKSQGESLRMNGVDLDYFLIQGKGIQGYLSHVAKLRDRIKHKSYDIVHAHYGLCGWVALLTFIKVPLVVSFMGDDLFGDADELGRQNVSDFFFINANKVLQYFIDFIIVKSANLAVHVKFKDKMEILPNGVDFELFKPMAKDEALRKLSINAKPNRKFVLFLGEITTIRKNFSLLQKAASDLPDIELITPYPIDSTKVPFFLNMADVLVLTSFKEGSPNVIKEAMACNCPIVSTDVGDVREVIGDTEGCYIASFDPADVVDKIKKALAFGKRTNGREKISHLEINTIAHRIINIYRKFQRIA